MLLINLRCPRRRSGDAGLLLILDLHDCRVGGEEEVGEGEAVLAGDGGEGAGWVVACIEPFAADRWGRGVFGEGGHRVGNVRIKCP